MHHKWDLFSAKEKFRENISFQLSNIIECNPFYPFAVVSKMLKNKVQILERLVLMAFTV